MELDRTAVGYIKVHPLLRDVIDVDMLLAQDRYNKRIAESPRCIADATREYICDLFVICADHHVIVPRTVEQVHAAYGPYLHYLAGAVISHVEASTSNSPSSFALLLKDALMALKARRPFYIAKALQSVTGIRLAGTTALVEGSKAPIGDTKASGIDEAKSLASSAGARKLRRRGPATDFASASRVAQVVREVAPDGRWKDRVLEICEALDAAEIPFPKKWHAEDKSCKSWSDYNEEYKCIKAIQNRLNLAKKVPQQTLANFS